MYESYVAEMTVSKAFVLGAYATIDRDQAVNGVELLKQAPLIGRLTNILGGAGGHFSQKKLGSITHQKALEHITDNNPGVNKTSFSNRAWSKTMHERVLTILAHARRLQNPVLMELASRTMSEDEVKSLKAMVQVADDEERSIKTLNPKAKYSDAESTKDELTDIQNFDDELPANLLTPRKSSKKIRTVPKMIPANKGELKRATLSKRKMDNDAEDEAPTKDSIKQMRWLLYP